MKLILTEEQYKLLLKEESKSLEQFYEENGINEDDLSYLGKGDFGTAYSIKDGRVLKITSSKNEFEIAQELEKDDAPVLNAFAKIYKTDIVEEKLKNNTDIIVKKYLIILEELDTDSSIEDLYYELQNLLEPQGLPIQYLDYLDIGEEQISDELDSFMSDMSDIIRAYRYLGIEASDIRPENLGYAEDGTLKAFDIDNKNR